jgi:hypothetical protein
LPGQKASRDHHHNDRQTRADHYYYQQRLHPFMLASGLADVVSPANRNLR